MKRYILLLLALAFAGNISAREVYSLNNDWRFFFRSENTSDGARSVVLPHTWNMDALSGTGTYRQTTADYLRDLYIPAEWKGRRLFLRFYGVQNVADVFINGQFAGEHRGGFTAFTIEITDVVRYDYDNTLHVMVSNTFESDVLPLSTEMNLYGGIYRDVELIVAGQTLISPLYFGTDGLLINQHSVSRESVEASATLHLSGSGTNCNVTISVTAPDGYIAAKKSVRAKLDGKPVNIPFTIANPELWSTSDPKLYRVEAVAATDTVTIYTGFRKIEVSPGEHFLLNGRTVPVRGVTLWHDRASAGSAFTESDYAEDLGLICDMGANAIRSAAAPHDPSLYDMCDRRGVLAWIDFPFVRSPFPADVEYIPTTRLKDNGRQQVREIIVQNYNHPSVVMWGVFSLLRGLENDLLDYLREINALTKELDPSRPTVACSNRDGDINFITDLIVWQQDFGWYKGQISDLDIWQESLARKWSHLRQAVCYGEGSAAGSAADLGAKNRTNIPFEIRQIRYHEGYISRLGESPLFWGIWINNMFDFGSTRYPRGIQDGGLVSLDRRQPKDIYYLYRSLWNESSPTLHIKGKQVRNRTRTQQSIKFYSSAVEEPVLTINGDTVAVHRLDGIHYASDTVNMRGRSDIILRAGDAADRAVITIGNVLKHR